jgi:hypothetical protein
MPEGSQSSTVPAIECRRRERAVLFWTAVAIPQSGSDTALGVGVGKAHGVGLSESAVAAALCLCSPQGRPRDVVATFGKRDGATWRPQDHAALSRSTSAKPPALPRLLTEIRHKN